MPGLPARKVESASGEHVIQKRMDRQREIIAKLQGAGGIHSVAGLAHELGVSDETIRRELRLLEKQGSLVREHGGARLTAPVFEGPLEQRMDENAAAKQRIAVAAAKFVHDGMIVFIDAGTTSCFIARQLAERRSLTIITNSLQVATELGGINGNRLFLAGGQMDYDYHAFSDHAAQHYVAGFTPHLSILSVGAIDIQRGLMDFHPGEAAMSKIAYATSERVLLGADSSKFGRYGLIHTAPLSSVDILVTDTPLDESYRIAFQHADVVTA